MFLPSDSSPTTLEDFKRVGIDLELLLSKIIARRSRGSEYPSLFSKAEIPDKVRLLHTIGPCILKPTVISRAQPLPTGTSGLVPLECNQSFAPRPESRPTHACSPMKPTSGSTDRCINPMTSRIFVQMEQGEERRVIQSA